MDRRGFLKMGLWVTAGIAGIGLGLAAPDPAFARGSTLEEAAKAQRIFERLATSGSGTPSMPKNGVITLAPGEVLTFSCDGYCLDLERAIPSEDDPMAFRPMTQYLAPEERKEYVALMRRGENIDMDKAGRQVHDMRQKKPGRPSQYADGGGFPAFWASQPMPAQNFRFSMLRADGVAGQARSTGNLSVQGSIANGSSKPFTFDPTQWVLESPRDVQAIGLPVPKTFFVAKAKKTNGESKPEPAQPKPAQSKPTQPSHGKQDFVGF